MFGSTGGLSSANVYYEPPKGPFYEDIKDSDEEIFVEMPKCNEPPPKRSLETLSDSPEYLQSRGEYKKYWFTPREYDEYSGNFSYLNKCLDLVTIRDKSGFVYLDPRKVKSFKSSFIDTNGEFRINVGITSFLKEVLPQSSQTGLKKYLLFRYSCYCAKGGLKDLYGSFDSLDEVFNINVGNLQDSYVYVQNRDTQEIIARLVYTDSDDGSSLYKIDYKG